MKCSKGIGIVGAMGLYTMLSSIWELGFFMIFFEMCKYVAEVLICISTKVKNWVCKTFYCQSNERD